MSRIIVRDGELLGAINELGEIVIEPSYDDMKWFSNGYAAVCKDGLWGYVDYEGNQVIDFLYDEAGDFSAHGVAPVKLNEGFASWALIKENGQLIEMEEPNNYHYIGDMNAYGYAVARYGYCYCIIDQDGNHINSDAYEKLEYLEDQAVFIGEKIGKSCFINTEGEVVIDPDDDYSEIYYPSQGLCQVVKDDKMGYINEEGKLVIPLKYQSAYAFSDNGLAYVEYDNGKGGYINTKGEFVIKPIFESGTPFEYGQAAVSKNGQYIFIDESGRKSIDCIFKYAGGFAQCGLAKIETLDGRVGFMKPSGEVAFMIPEEWEVEEYIGDRKISTLKIGNNVGLINNDGDIILEPSYEDIEISAFGDIHLFCKDGLWGYLDHDGKVVIENMYDEAREFTKDHLAMVKSYDPIEDKIIRSYINKENEIVDCSQIELSGIYQSPNYSKVGYFYKGQELALAIKKEKTKILNAYGEEIIIQQRRDAQ